MHQRKLFRISICLISLVLQTHGADKNPDENRPYEFGFNVEIEGMKQQHRHEKKDKDGIIMGEFGFVTADDVYHVTVYATDKEGRFKILSMKNIHLKSAKTPTTASAPPARQGHSLALPASPAAQPIQSPKPQPLSPALPVRSCSSCSIPSTSPRAPVPVSQNQPQFPASGPASVNNGPGGFGSPAFSKTPGSPNYPQPGPGAHLGPQQTGPSQQNYPASINAQLPNAPNNFEQSGVPPSYGQNQQANPPQNILQPPINSNTQAGGPHNYNGQSLEEDSYPQAPGSRAPKQYTGGEQQFNSNQGSNGPQAVDSAGKSHQGNTKPTLVSAQMQIVDKDTDIHALRSGEQPGLPKGLSESDMSQLLYTFNYTLGFHGHFEEGYTNGVKKGYYFVTGRNGVKTRIDYVADDTGFHPKVSQEVLDLISDEVPKPETEKDEKYGLKGYEFKWLYYPVESKKQ